MKNPTIDLSQVPKTMVRKFIQLLAPIGARFLILWGGAGSGKSYSTAQMIVYKSILEPGHHWLVCRKVKVTLRHSVIALVLHVLHEWALTGLYSFNKSDFEIKFYNGSTIQFVGLDDVEKLKSIFPVTGIWFEEASEGTPDDVQQLNLRLRGYAPVDKLFVMTFNPISVMHWIKAEFFDRPRPNTKRIHSTYLDNQYLDEEYKAELAAIDDPYYRQVYALGEWGLLGNVVFTNIVIEEFDYTEDDLENVCNGMDFGFAHASAIERVGFRDGELYSFDELHGKGWTNPRFIEHAKEHFGDAFYTMPITADSAEPARIEEWREEGAIVVGAKKGKDSLRFGIDYLSRTKWHIHATRCPNLAKEVQSFKRREDRDGNALDDFVEINDDGIAAARYATEWIWGQTHGEVETAFSAADFGL